jgi:hypothetical protein
MAKLNSPLKIVRLEMDLSRSELASLVYHRREDHAEKVQLSQAIARCEAGLLEPDNDPVLNYLFDSLAKQGYKTLKDDQVAWIKARKKKLEE